MVTAVAVSAPSTLLVGTNGGLALFSLAGGRSDGWVSAAGTGWRR